MYTFGCNDEGALGRTGEETEPGLMDVPGSVIQVSAGDSHTGLLLADGSVYACGTFRVSLMSCCCHISFTVSILDSIGMLDMLALCR